MTVNKVEIGFDLSEQPGAEFARLDDAFYGILDAPQTILGGAVFQDVSPFLLGIQLSRGKSRQLDRYSAGRLQVNLNNNSRIFDPLYELSPYRGQIIPKRAVRFTSNEQFIPATLDTNRITNPSFEAQSTTTVTNLVTNPSFETNTTGWTGSGGTTQSRITTDSVFGSACISFVAPLVNNALFNNGDPVTASTTYTLSAYVKGESGKTYNISLEERTASAAVGATASSTITANGQWQRVSVTRAFGATGVVARFVLRNLFAGSQTILVDGVMLTAGTTTEPYFDGNSTANDTTFAWTGTANNSTSTRACNALVPARTNLMPNPNFELNSTQWASGRTTLSLDDSTFLYGSRALRGTTNTAWAVNSVFIDHSTRVSVSAGVTYTFSAYVFCPLTNAADTNFQLRAFPFTTSLQPSTGGTTVTVTRGQWTRISVTVTMPAGTVSVLTRVLSASSMPIGDVYIIDGVMVEEGDTLGEYFDGNDLPSGDYVYDWSGVIGLSASRQEVRQIVGSSSSQNSAAGMSRAWDSTGSRSLVVAPTGQSNDSHIRFSISGLTNGATYTAMVKARLIAPLTGTLNARSRQISAWNSTFTTNAGSISAPNTAGVHDLRFTFTANDTTMIIALHNGANVNNGLVWFDDFLLVEGDYQFEYFDGNSYNSNPIITYAWLGAENDSQSTRSKEAESKGIQYEGVIDDWDLSYSPQGNSVASIIASDAFTQFANQTLVAGSAVAETTGERIERVLSNAGVLWPLDRRQIETGRQVVQAQQLPEGGNALQYLQTIAASEPGALFVSKSGTVVFRDRAAQIGATTTTFADDGSGIPYQGLEVIFGAELLYNEVEVSRLGGGTAIATNLESQTEYGIQNLTISGLPLDDDASAENLATYLVTQYAQPEYRFESIDLELENLTAEQQTVVLGIELGDFVRVKFTPNDIPPAIDRYAEVIGIQQTVTPASHRLSFNLASAEYNFFRLSDLVFGRLSTENALGY